MSYSYSTANYPAIGSKPRDLNVTDTKEEKLKKYYTKIEMDQIIESVKSDYKTKSELPNLEKFSTKVINVTWTSTTSPNSSINNFSCHYPVKKIRVRQIICNSGDNTTGGYFILFGDLMEGKVIGSFFINQAYPASNIDQGIVHIFQEPRQFINSTLNFNLQTPSGVPATLNSGDTYNIAIID